MIDLFDPVETWKCFAGNWGADFDEKYDKNKKYFHKYGQSVVIPVDVLNLIRMVETDFYFINDYIGE